MDNTTNTNQDLTLVAQYSLDAYKAKFNNSKLDIINNPKKPGSLFFSCGILPNGQPNYGAVGEKAKALIQQHAPSDKLRVSVYKTHQTVIENGQTVVKEIELPILQANSTANVVASY
jgi:hypothetical protein